MNTYTHRVTCLVFVLLVRAAFSLANAPICFEAESAGEITPPMRVVSATTNATTPDVKGAVDMAGGNAFLEIPQGAGNPPVVVGGEAAYSFEIDQEADYYLWCRVWWTDECGNSFTIRMDETAPFSFGQDSTFKCWHWVKAPARLSQMRLSKGRHTLRIGNREDGARIDQVLLTTDRKYVPVDIERTP